jgi:hypothetical protein
VLKDHEESGKYLRRKGRGRKRRGEETEEKGREEEERKEKRKKEKRRREPLALPQTPSERSESSLTF